MVEGLGPPMKGNLPFSVDSFVGRETELGELAGAMASSRLLTLTGPAGVGKTRLALEAARIVAARYPDGAWLAILSPVAAPEFVSQAVAAVFNLQEQHGRPFSDTLVAHLRHRRLLLVLDNAEHLAEACGALVGLLRGSCPDVGLVVTSREPLGVESEQVVPVSALRVPPDPDAGPEIVAAFPAVQLFRDRAAAFLPGFGLDAGSATSVAEICRRLDGLPLALELAAARVAVLSPAEIAARLEDRFALLTTGNRAGLPHHQSLRATLDWSYDLLAGVEATLFRRLAVFAGSAPTEAIVDICAGGAVERGQVGPLLASLVSRSLVVDDRQQAAPRYRLLETVGAYARERLNESGETGALRARHASWYLGFAERLEPELTGPDQPGALARVGAEHDNLRAALRWALENDPAAALCLAGAMTLYWRLRGHYTEGAAFLGRALAKGGSASVGDRAKALWGTGFLALLQDAFTLAVALLEESLALWRTLGDEAGTARATLILGNTLSLGDEPEDRQRARSLLEESAALARRTADGWCLAHALALLAEILDREDEPRAATLLLEESVFTSRLHRDAQGLRIGLFMLARMRLSEGAYSSAEDLLREGLTLARALVEPYGVEVALAGLAEVAAGRGDYGRARELLGPVIDEARRTDQPITLFLDLCSLGRIVRDEGDAAAARALFREAIEVAAGRPDLRDGPAALGMGQAEADLGNVTAAAAWLEQALATARSDRSARNVATSLYELANVARATGDGPRAASLHEDALRMRLPSGRLPDLLESLEAVAGNLVDLGRHDEATCLFGSAQKSRDRGGLCRPPRCRSAYAADVGRAKAALGAARFETLLRQGAELSPAEAFGRLSQPRRRRNRPSFGWTSLTGAERAVAALVSEGLTNAEVAERLYISPGTVRVHLTSVFAKLGITSRSELPKETFGREG